MKPTPLTDRLSRYLPVVAFAWCLLAGCQQLSRQVQTANVSGAVTRVVDRHDAYVNADPVLAADAKAVALKQAAFLRAEMQKPQVPAAEIAPALSAVADRHDAYVNADATLADYKKRADLLQTQALRTVLKAGQ